MARAVRHFLLAGAAAEATSVLVDLQKAKPEDIDTALEPLPGGSGPRIVAEARFLADRLRRLVDSGEAQSGALRESRELSTVERSIGGDDDDDRPFALTG